MTGKRFIGLVGGLALVAAACSSGASSDQLNAAAGLADSVAALQTNIDHTTGEFSALGPQLDAAGGALTGFVGSAQVQAIDRTADIADPPAGMVAVRLSFGTVPEPLPGLGVQVHDPLPDVSTVWATESLEAGNELPVGDAIDGGTVFLAPGEKRAVALVYENPTEATVRFMAVPHQDSPGSLNGMIWPQCLCFSFPYEAPAGGSWYRVIELTASPQIPEGSKVDILWTLLTDESVFPEA